MKTSRLLFAVVAVVICAFAPDAAHAAKRPRLKPTPVPEKINAHAALIVTVSNGAIEVKSSHETAKYRIDSRTSITLDGERATVGALKAGMYADVTASTIDPSLAVSIAATNPKSH